VTPSPERVDPLAPADTLIAPATDTLPVPADTLDVGPERAAPARTPERPVLRMPGPGPRPALNGTPARQPVFEPAALLAPVPGAFHYDLAVVGAAHGVALGLTAPHRLALTLDGRPAGDVFTGRAALELLPENLLAPLSSDPGRYGAPDGLAADFRAFAASVPITELRYRAGPDGHQFVTATHAQTRRPGFVRSLGGDNARMTVLFHVGGQGGGHQYANTRVSGWQLVGRVGLSLPGMAVEVTERNVRRTAGTWGGVDPLAPDPYVATAPSVDPIGEREVITNDLSLRVARRLLPGAQPLVASAYWIAATHRFTAVDTVQAAGDLYGVLLDQGLLLGAHRLRARFDIRTGRLRSGDALPADAMRPELHAYLTDSTSVAGFEVALRGGWHASGDEAFPSAGLHVRRAAGPVVVDAGVFAGGAPLAAAERVGFGQTLIAEPPAGERVLGARAGLEAVAGPIRGRLAGEVRRQRDPRLLLLEEDGTARSVTASGAMERALATAELELRGDAARGLYARLWGATQVLLNVEDSPLHRREAAALPETWGYGRLGFRAMRMFDGALDLDVFARGRAWTAYGSRVPHGPTGLLALPPATSPAVPASGALDLVLEATLGEGRAVVFVAYQNALADVAYPGTFVVPLYPLARPAARLGVFWVLPN
jgi:hypothetical protein